MRAATIILLCASATATDLVAQEQTADVVPRELAVALLDRYGMSSTQTEIVVGRVPKSFPADALPRGEIRILGGAEREGGASVIAELPEPPDGAAARVAAQLARAGWRRLDEERASMGGFVPSSTTRPTVYCRANGVLTYTARARQGRAGSLLHASASYPERYSQCTMEAERARRFPESRPSLPTLESPPDVRFLGAGYGGGGGNSREAFIRIETSLDGAALGAHYVEQLQRAGWTVHPPVRGEGIVVYRARKRDDDKRELTGVLMVLAIPDTQQFEAVYRVVRAEEPPR